MALTCERCQHENSDEARFCLQCGAMLEAQGEPAEGEDAMLGRILLGRYRVVKVLGEGGMGKVYLAEQKMGTATRKVAIKTLHPELSGDPQLVARFHRECETVIQLHHPNTVQFYDFGDLEDNTLFIVMEFIEGEDLSKRLERDRRLDPAMVDKLLIQICGSLAEAHERGVVHRDLKPENVLLTTRGGQVDFVKLLDFGIAKRSEAEDEKSAKLTKQGMVLGTPPYMSPEQFSGQQLDLRSDIYSLAIMTYEMITGQLPFEARTPWEWATKHLTAQPVPIQQQPGGAGLADHKAAAIMRGMSKDREARQGSALQFMHELTGIGDAQAAWTMATSTGVGSQTGGASSSVPHTQASPTYDTGGQQRAGTPGPMPRHATPSGPFQPQGQSHPYPTPGPHPQHPMHTPTPGPTEFPSGPMQVPGSGGAGKWVAIVVIAFMVLGGGAGGLWWFLNREPEPVAVTENPTTNQLPTPQPVASQMNTEPVINMEPSQVTMTEPTMEAEMVEPAMVEPAMVEPAMVEMEEEPEMTSMGSSGPSSADLARARAAVSQGEAALGRNDIDGAITAVIAAQRATTRNHASHRSLRGDLGRRASNTVGILMQQGKCREAQALFRKLRQVRADGPSRQHFSPDWCPQP